MGNGRHASEVLSKKLKPLLKHESLKTLLVPRNGSEVLEVTHAQDAAIHVLPA